MNYEAYFNTAKHNEIPFGIAFNMLCNLEGVMSDKEQEFFFATIQQYSYTFDGKNY